MLPFIANVSCHIYKYMCTHRETHEAYKYGVNNMRVKGQLLSCLIFLACWKQASSHYSWINGEHMLGGGHYLPVAAI